MEIENKTKFKSINDSDKMQKEKLDIIPDYDSHNRQASYDCYSDYLRAHSLSAYLHYV